uniref:NADH-ubiquinone oxidoreductase chain 6 n=1 Tax=Scolytinae sp. BMNH 1274282 TaxID=2558034 RepID=A0A126TF77_9CUCU|nr:NADH dehydrogenase subunit 6 [Scolytinae sp. BMNH 1274282]
MVITWMLSSMFMFMNHPLAMGGILLIQTMIMSMMSGMLFTNFWFSYILFLIMVGGMLVMFMYMTSIASNEKFLLPSPCKMLITTIIMMTSITTILLMDKTLISYMSQTSMHKMSMNMMFMNSLTKFFNSPNMIMSIMLMSYMLLTLIAIVKITDKKMGPLRQK